MKALRNIRHQWPDIFEYMDKVATDESFKTDWDHSLTYAPMASVIAYVQNKLTEKGLDPNHPDIDTHMSAVLATALGGWRISKTIYDFDPDLSEELYLQSSAEKNIISTSALRLPYWSIYIRPNRQDTSGKKKIDGFFVHFDCYRYHRNDKEKKELRFIPLDKNGNPLFLLYLNITDEDKTIDECIQKTADELDQDTPVPEEKKIDIHSRTLGSVLYNLRDNIARWISLVLYLSASNAEIRQNTSAPFKRTKKVRDIPREIELLDVGQDAGIRIRTLKKEAASHPSDSDNPREEKSHKSPAMHIRRAHWHTYYTGSRKIEKEKRKTIVHWIEPVIVNQNNEEIPLTVVNVKQ